MIVNANVFVIKALRRQGVGKKSGNPYDFTTVRMLDENGNVFDAGVDRSIIGPKLDALLEIIQENLDVTLELRPKGFDVSLTLIDWK